MTGSKDKLNHQRTHDPIRQSATEAPRFNKAWLKNGESLTLIQRTGFTIISLAFVGSGLGLASFFIQDLRSEISFFTLVYGVLAVSFLLLGFLGLKNALRFRKN